MKRKKLRVSLLDFLTTGRFGPLVPCRDISPEKLIAVLGASGPIEVCAHGTVDYRYRVGDPACFPVIVPYGSVEFHFDSPSTLNCIFHDNPFAKKPFGNAGMALSDVALLKYGRPIGEFLSLCKSIGLMVGSAKPYSQPYGLVIKTVGSVDVGFEVDDPEDQNEEATLRWFSLKL